MSSIYGSLVLFAVFSFESTLGSTTEFTGILVCTLMQITVLPCVGTIAVARLAASYRYAVMLSLLWLMLLIPVVVCLFHLSGWRLPIPVGQLRPSPPIIQAEPILPEGSMIIPSLPVLTELEEADAAVMGTDASTLTTNRAVSVANSKSEATANPSLPTARLRWYHVLILIWAVGVVVSLGRFIYGILVVRRLLRASQRLEVPLSVAKQLQTVFRMKDLPDLREVVDLPVPIMTGIRQPVIVVPQGLADQLTTDEFCGLIFHEYAHARRGDCVVGCMQRVAEIVYWFHPVVYWLNRRLSIAREEICDNYALLVTQPTVYARLLLRLNGHCPRVNSIAAMPLISPEWKLEDRIKGVLDPKRNLVTKAWRTRLTSMLAFMTLCVLLSSIQLVTAANEQSSKSVDLYGDPIPNGARVQLGTQRFRSNYHIRPKISFTPDNQIFSLNEGGSLHWWEARTGKLIRSRHLDDVFPRGFAVSPDRTLVAYSYLKMVKDDPTTEYGIRLHDLPSGDEVAKILFKERLGEAKMTFTPDGRTIICASDSGKMFVIDVTSREVLLDFNFPGQSEFQCIAVSPDGSQVAAATRRKLFIWNWSDGTDPEEVEGEFESSYALTYSPDGKWLLVGQNNYGKRRESIDLLNLTTRKVTHGFEDPVMKRFRIANMLFANNGKWLIVPNGDYVGNAKDNAILVWDFASKELIHRLQCDNAQPGMVALSKDEQLLATSSRQEISVWDLEKGNRVAADFVGHNASIQGVRFTPDGQNVITVSDDQTVRVWDANTGEQLGRAEHLHWVRGVNVSPDGKWFVTSSLDDTVRLFARKSMKQIYELPGHGETGGFRTVAFAADSSKFATYGDDAYLRVWDVATGKALLEERVVPGGRPMPRGHFDRFSHSEGVLSPDASRLLVFDRQSAHLFDAVTGKEIERIESTRPIQSACFVPGNEKLLVARPYVDATRTPQDDGRVRFSAPDKFEAVMIDLKNKQELWSFKTPHRNGPLGVSPDGRIAVFGTQGKHDGTLFLLDASNGTQLGKIESNQKLALHKNGGNVSFSHDGRMAVASHNTVVLVWDLKQMGIWNE